MLPLTSVVTVVHDVTLVPLAAVLFAAVLMCSRTVMVRCVCTHRQAIGAEPRGVVIDFGCAQELAPDGTLTVSQAYTRTFTLEGNQYGRAPELFMELEAAKREVHSCSSVASRTFVSAMSSFSC